MKFAALIICDGFGYTTETYGNAIRAAGIPYIRSLKTKYPHTLVGASGLDVGLPDGQMGNSEVGHLNIGAGRVVYQDFTRVSKAITDGDFFQNAAFIKAMDSAKNNGKKLHLMGLLGPGGVHSHIEHLFALLKMCKLRGVTDVFVHCFTDGRDLPPESGAGYVAELEEYMKTLGVGKIATVTGRYYAMDRDNRWDRVEKAYDMLTLGAGEKFSSASDVMAESYKNGVTDEFVLPSVIMENGKPVATVTDGDSIIFYNFRPDRAREITRSFINEDFSGFERKTGYLAPVYVGLTRYDDTFVNLDTAFKPQSLNNTLGQYFASLGVPQLRIAETEKYAHVTFFFNGGVEAPNPLEDRVLVPSPKVATYDLKPSMSAYEVAERAVELIKSGKYKAMILNFANCDMVGHTGSMEAATEAVVTVDNCVKSVVEAIREIGGVALVTADHGNADKMMEADGSPFTAHSTNPVPLIVVDDSVKAVKDGGKLCDLAPTMLAMMGLPVPEEMTGRILIEK